MRHSYLAIILFLLLESLLIDDSMCNMVKRRAPDGKLYVFSKREGCVSVQSANPCTLSWKLNTYIANVYEQENEIVLDALKLYAQLGYSSTCRNAVKEVLCSQVTPKCSESDYSRDYGNATKLCNNLYSYCPSSFVNSLKTNNCCTNLKKGRHSYGQCVANTAYVTGACPQPMFKMTTEFLDDYRKKSASVQMFLKNITNQRYSDGGRIFSDACVSQMREISCVPIYCSANETELLVELDSNDCHRVVRECFNEPLKRLSPSSDVGKLLNTLRNQLGTSCNKYPASSSDLRFAPPRIAGNSSLTKVNGLINYNN